MTSHWQRMECRWCEDTDQRKWQQWRRW